MQLSRAALHREEALTIGGVSWCNDGTVVCVVATLNLHVDMVASPFVRKRSLCGLWAVRNITGVKL